MDLGADIFIGATPPPDTLRAAVARAFAVPVDRVAIRRAEAAWPVADVVLEDIDDDAPVPGDYPLQLLPWASEERLTDLPPVLSALAQGLGAPVLTSDDERYEIMNLYLPDGSAYDVDVDQDEDGGIRNTLQMRRLIDAAPQSPRRAVAS